MHSIFDDTGDTVNDLVQKFSTYRRHPPSLYILDRKIPPVE